MAQENQEKLYTTGTAGEFLGVVPRTVASLMKNGYLKGYRLAPTTGSKLGRDRRIPELSLFQFLVQRGYDFELAPFEDGKADVVLPKFLSAGTAAEILGVAPRTACKYFDNGMLNGYTLPDSGKGEYRKFCRKSLLNFVTEIGRIDCLGAEQLEKLGIYPAQSQSEQAA